MPSVRKDFVFRLRSRIFRVPGFVILSLLVVLAPYYLSGQFAGLTEIDGPDESNLVTQALPIRKNDELDGLQQLLPKEVLEALEDADKNTIFLDTEGRVFPKEPDSLASDQVFTQVAETIINEKTNTTGDLIILGESVSVTTHGDSKGEVNGTDSDIGVTIDSKDSSQVSELLRVNTSDPAWRARKELRLQRQEERLKLLTSGSGSGSEEVALGVDAQQTSQATQARLLPPAGVSQLQQKYSIWRKEESPEGGNDQIVRLIRDQLIMARAYLSLAQQDGDSKMARELKVRLKDNTKSLAEATEDSELPSGALERMRVMGQLLVKAREQHYDCTSMVKKLRAMVQSAEDQARTLKKQSAYLSQLAAKTIPRGINCLSLRLTNEYFRLPPEKKSFTGTNELVDKSLYHYALFSDNVLAAAVVVNSTVVNALDSSKHVFHIVTDRLNYAAMKMWFLLNPPQRATLEVNSIDDFKWLNSSYCPVLRQLETASMKEYYFKAAKLGSDTDGHFLKYRNPKYLSMLNHLRFYLPDIYPQLEKILFVDDDIVVQKDLTPLWEVNMNGNVNGAVLTCGQSFHRYDKYLNFSHPLIASNFDPQACGWAYGMNVFDLKAWRQFDMTGIYHYWQNQNEDRQLWKLGTLPPGLITFYNVTQPLKKTWHALGLGYNPGLDTDELDGAAVVHYNGNMKPWLDIAIAKFKPYWTKYVKYDHPFLQQCNINE